MRNTHAQYATHSVPHRPNAATFSTALHGGADVRALVFAGAHPQVRGEPHWVLTEMRRNHARLVAMTEADQRHFGRTVGTAGWHGASMQRHEGAEYHLIELGTDPDWPAWGLGFATYGAAE